MRKDENRKVPDRVEIKLGPSKYDTPQAIQRAIKNSQADAVTIAGDTIVGGGGAAARLGTIQTIDTTNSVGTLLTNQGELLTFYDATSRSLQTGWEIIVVQDELTENWFAVGVAGNATYNAPAYTAPVTTQGYPVDGLIVTNKLRATVYPVGLLLGGSVGTQWVIDEGGVLGFGAGAIIGSVGAADNQTPHHPRTTAYNPATGASSLLPANTLSSYSFAPARSIYYILGNNLFEFFYSTVTTAPVDYSVVGTLYMWNSGTGSWSNITSGQIGGFDSGYIWMLADGPFAGLRAYVRAIDGTGTVTSWQPTALSRYARGIRVNNGAVWTKTSSASTGGTIVIARGSATLSASQTSTGQTGNIPFFSSDINSSGNLVRLVSNGTSLGLESINYSTAVLTSYPSVWSSTGLPSSGEPWMIDSIRYIDDVLTVTGAIDESVAVVGGTSGYAIPALWQTDGTTTTVIHYDDSTNAAADACAGSLVPLASGTEVIWIDAGSTSTGSAPTNYTYQMSWIYRATL